MRKSAKKAIIGQKLADVYRQREHEMTLAALRRSQPTRCEADAKDREEWLFRGRKSAKIHPEVLEATADELIAAGWGWHERCLIPPDFKTKRPGKITAGREKLTLYESETVNLGAGTRKKAANA